MRGSAITHRENDAVSRESTCLIQCHHDKGFPGIFGEEFGNIWLGRHSKSERFVNFAGVHRTGGEHHQRFPGPGDGVINNVGHRSPHLGLHTFHNSGGGIRHAVTFFDHIQRDRGVAQETTRPRNVGVRSAIESITDDSGQIIPTGAVTSFQFHGGHQFAQCSKEGLVMEGVEIYLRGLVLDG